MQQEQQQPVEVVCLVAPEDASFLTQWEEQLWPLQEEGYLVAWSELHLSAETSLQEEIEAHLQRADLIVLLVSPSFFASALCLALMQQVLDRYIAGEAQLFCILLQPVDTRELSQVSSLFFPSNGLPVTQWDDVQAALRACAGELLALIQPEGTALSLEVSLGEAEADVSGEEPLSSEEEEAQVIQASMAQAELFDVTGQVPHLQGAYTWSWKRALWSLPGSLLLGITGGLCAVLLYGLFAWFSHGRIMGLFYALFISIPAVLPLGMLLGIGGALLGSILSGFEGREGASLSAEHEEFVG